MNTRRSMLLGALSVAIVIVASAVAQAASIDRVFIIQGDAELWNWTTTGQTKLGAAVTSTTMPSEMADPAKMSWYDQNGVLLGTYRNYRPEPNGYVSLNNWKTSTAVKLVSYNLAGKASPISGWGESGLLAVTAIAQPTASPGYDNVGTGWFAQTDYRSELGADAPTWWCESQTNAIDKNLTGTFQDLLYYTFDNSALNLDNTVTLWLGGFVTNDLAGMEAHTAGYGILEGAVKAYAYTDLDGDGYLGPPGVGTDCCDDPNASCTARGGYIADPPICASCTCGVAACAPCARCIHPSAQEFSGDTIDSNCNNQNDCFIATASFGTSLEGKIDALRAVRDRYLITGRIGRALVDMYYYYSPDVASYIRTHEAPKAVVRTVLLPVVGASWLLTSHKAGLLAMGMGLAIGMIGLGIRRNRMKGVILPLLVVALVSLPIAASATVADDISASLASGMPCGAAVEKAILAGQPAGEVIVAAVKICPNVSEIITSAIAAGADPFTVAYAAKGAGVDLKEVVSALENGKSSVKRSAEELKSFTPPEPVVPMTPAYVITGTGSSWGRSHYVASPSL